MLHTNSYLICTVLEYFFFKFPLNLIYNTDTLLFFFNFINFPPSSFLCFLVAQFFPEASQFPQVEKMIP